MSLKELKDVLEYDPDTGNFYWLIFRKNAKGIAKFPMLKPAGNYSRKPKCKTYLTISYKSITYSCGRLAFFLVTGNMPPEKIFVDHIDGDTLNNKWRNLRLLTPTDNAKNIVSKTDDGLLFCRCFFKKNKADKKQFFEPDLPSNYHGFL